MNLNIPPFWQECIAGTISRTKVERENFVRLDAEQAE
jgi:hypothetical protein